MKFESVVLEQESQGPPAAVGERRGGAALYYLDSLAFVDFFVCYLSDVM